MNVVLTSHISYYITKIYYEWSWYGMEEDSGNICRILIKLI
jgi:hypothetical protein